MNQYVTRALCAAVLISLPVTGCVCATPPADPGSLTFGWSFEGVENCTTARVRDLDIDVIAADGAVAYNVDGLSCSGGEVTIQDLEAGSYDVFIDAFDDAGAQLYAATVSTSVSEATERDLGTVDLNRVGATGTGDIAFYWDFDGATNCTSAGVDEVDVQLVDASDDSVALSETFPCAADEGLIIEDIPPGDYVLFLDAYTTADAHLFTGNVTVEVLSGELVDLDVVYLDPVAASSGNLALSWTFAGETCSQAGVNEVDIELLQNNSQVFFMTYPCSDGDALIEGLEPGNYTVYVDGYTSGGDWTYTLDATATIDIGLTTDLGTVDLASRGGDSALTFVWAFLYPGDLGETDCARAGVSEIEVTLDPVGTGAPYVETVACSAGGGLTIEPVDSGDYTLRIRASGVYGGSSIDLYDSGLINVTMASGEQDLGEFLLPRVSTSFADLNISWTVLTNGMAGACADIGADAEITATITRETTPEVVDDAFTAPCSDLGNMRQTFVPGMYRVDLVSGDFSGSTSVDAAPATNTAVGIVLTGDTVGTVTLGWTFNGADCPTAGVANVDVVLSQNGTDVSTTTVTCGDNTTSIAGVLPGTYVVTLTGKDAGDAALFSLVTAATVSAGMTTALGTLDLM